MTSWQRFGDGTWVNVDHVEVVRVEEQDDGSWQLVAAFASGRVHPLGSHEDRDLLLDATDVVLRGEVGERLRPGADTDDQAAVAVVETADPEPVAPVASVAPVAARRKRWWFGRSDSRSPGSAQTVG